ncbi:hypothetical protein [Streptomyces sp. PT12]|uniref:hypothetical protein n=1 Tax=Streptomyces sp. PT12 TaxID=1510197 RepID=UPI000DE207FC|nr:hypothetical protein [Streptomyces sp. PT12]RBM12695.1 hypothetical protein DEH69_19845 [Streptomyces sp. PT12]
MKPPGSLVSVQVNAATVRRHDHLVIGGQAFVVTDLTTMTRGRKRLEFHDGQSLTISATTVLWAARWTPYHAHHRRGAR